MRESRLTEDRIKKLRQEINLIDHQLFDLLLQRMDIVQKIADIKKSANIAVHDPEREAEILRIMTQRAKKEGVAEDFSPIFRAIMQYSKDLQEER